ncbi:MBOAT family protein [Sedimentibacter sp. zth1]|uniref:MBOAT family O-acyltransferase n=1 Tax=Sedimentibacter sp. zth1 TaxID=2816908 RepID=UPI001A91CDE2|nr:MBOAT family protein [Sedimentibacter sp. zth1]QSX06176.1 MBOAT family protein [Sedimentibacter sp. zth1]
MLFSSSIFIFLFLPCVLFIYFVFLRSIKSRNIFLLFSSLMFYAWGEPKFVFIMLLSILANYIFGLLINEYRNHNILSKIILTTMVVFNLSIIFIYKYLMFFMNNINNIFNLEINVPSITLPIGISFFTFQAISYVVDIYRKDGQVQKNPLNVGLYISFFPQLIAGPIVRYQTVAKQISNRKETFKGFSDGVCRFIVGMCKKVLLANTFAIFADKAFNSNLSSMSVAMAWLGALSYTFQIYYDFSGYSDMAIGLGKMFGFNFNENFNYPYISRSISEFWRRWHISLGTWFKDYVYIPLGGSRVSHKSRLIFNLFTVWILTGIWHGANWTFIIWGLYYFILLSIEKLFDFENKFKNIKYIKWLYTFVAVMLGWVLFRSNDINSAFIYIKAMLGLNNNLITDNFLPSVFEGSITFFIIAIIGSFPITRLIKNQITAKNLNNNFFFNLVYTVSFLLLYIISLSYIVKGTYNPFIYFNF